MNIMQISFCTNAVHNGLDCGFVFGNDRKPNIIFVTTDVIVRNCRFVIHDGSKLFHRCLRMMFCRKIIFRRRNLPCTKSRNKAEFLRIVHATNTANYARRAHFFNFIKNFLFRDNKIRTLFDSIFSAITIQHFRKRLIRAFH